MSEVLVEMNRFPVIAAELRGKADELERASAARIAQDATARAPYADEEPHIRDTISADGNEVDVDNPHGGFVEYGTSRMAAQPYLRPAVEADRANLEAEGEAMLNGL